MNLFNTEKENAIKRQPNKQKKENVWIVKKWNRYTARELVGLHDYKQKVKSDNLRKIFIIL